MPVGEDFSYVTSTVNDMALVRWICGDTVKATAKLSDTEINNVLSLQPVVTYAAAACCDAIAALFSAKADLALGKTRVSLSQKAKAYERLADRLRKGGPGKLPGGDGSGVFPTSAFVGGTSKSELEAFHAETDLIQSSFEIGKDDIQGLPDNADDPSALE